MHKGKMRWGHKTMQQGVAGNRWLIFLRIFIGAYFVWRGVVKLTTSPEIWMVPRVTPALPRTPLAPLITGFVYPHMTAVSLVLGLIEVIFGAMMVLNQPRVAGLVLASLNILFFLTLGATEHDDMALNVVMGTLNLMFYFSAEPLRRKGKMSTRKYSARH
ncbi:MAG: hypothetical protein OWS74_01430 [Firmicutes bacterium]|nr:hypothetical protein [Bacillota bacterium]